jgi:hypothetical protein
MECKLVCVNFGRVSEQRRAFVPAFGVTGITDLWYSSIRGVNVGSLGTSWRAGENFGWTWEHG